MGINYRTQLERQKGRMLQLKQELKVAERRVDKLHLSALYTEEAQVLIQQVAQLTQSELEYHISELVTLAMASVFDEPYGFNVDFALRRNRTECDLTFNLDNKIKVDPMTLCEGGAVDVASFALRVALWSLSPQRTRNVLVLDEPLKFLKGDELPERGAEMIKEISAKIGLQVIMISHVPDQIAGADKRIHVKKRKGKSEVK